MNVLKPVFDMTYRFVVVNGDYGFRFEIKKIVPLIFATYLNYVFFRRSYFFKRAIRQEFRLFCKGKEITRRFAHPNKKNV